MRVRTLKIRNALLYGKVFLSASFPRADRTRRYFASADPDELTQAIVAAAQTIFFAGASVVFGGHPSISPLIMMLAEEHTFGTLFQVYDWEAGGAANLGSWIETAAKQASR